MRDHSAHSPFIPTALAAVLALSAAGLLPRAAAAGDAAPAASPTPVPPSVASPSPAPPPQANTTPAPAPPSAAPPAAPSTPSPSPAPVTGPAAAPPALPRIVRTVCTDRICGNCDGKCHKNSGHVALDKKGHCACTPSEGSPLDQATRQAYEKNQPQ